MRARANKPGIATITLSATTPCNVFGGCRVQPSFSSSVKIEIFEELRLINEGGTEASLEVLMAPNSSMKLRTNRDKFGSTTYKVLSSGQFGVESDDPNALSATNNVISVDKNGILKAGDHYGNAIVTVTNVEAYSSKQVLTIAVYVSTNQYLHSYVKIYSIYLLIYCYFLIYIFIFFFLD